MDKFNLLDCTLRDGGYITNWEFSESFIKEIIAGLIDSNLDFVEVGYLNNKPYVQDTAIFHTIAQIKEYLPLDRKNSMILAMADVTQFKPEDITPYDGKSIDGIRVVFYKHQIEEALTLCKAVTTNGYKLFVQPMVTIDYTSDEYAKLAKRITELKPYAVSIVDSFGYMIKRDFRQYFKILDNILDPNVIIGFHSHNNMQLAFITAQDILDYETTRHLVIDASLYGMGRGAGNLNTELIANYYNMNLGYKYDIHEITSLISKYIMPIAEVKEWGYSPYFFITGFYHCHPNFASYLLETHDVSVSDFEEYVKRIPEEMLTKCRKPYVEELYQKFIGENK
jgi:4-hydroxy 2-oxovalerate aldolase